MNDHYDEYCASPEFERLTDKGREYGEEKPYSKNGHSGYSIAWNKKVLDILKG